MDETPLPQSNVTHANITGKVLRHAIGKPPRRRKGVKLSADKRHHVRGLMKRGAISAKAAVQSGLAAKAK